MRLLSLLFLLIAMPAAAQQVDIAKLCAELADPAYARRECREYDERPVSRPMSEFNGADQHYIPTNSRSVVTRGGTDRRGRCPIAAIAAARSRGANGAPWSRGCSRANGAGFGGSGHKGERETQVG